MIRDGSELQILSSAPMRVGMWEKPLPYPHGTSLRLREIATDASTWSADAFAASYGRAFFVLHSQRRGGSVVGRTRSDAGSPDASAEQREDTSPFEIVALPCVRRPESSNPFVCIGRLQGNDITINDGTVSKYHAFVREDLQGGFVIQDGKSRNGTWVDLVKVSARGEGQPLALRSGQNVRFGSVSTTFLEAADLLTLARRLLS